MIRAFDKWLPGYLNSVMRRPAEPAGTKHLMFCLADHFEPSQFRSENAAEETRNWVRGYADAVKDFRDADGKPPQHTFFYPQEEYAESCLNCLAAFCDGGWGEIEIHLHHRNDTPDGFKSKLVEFRDTLRQRHNLLGSDRHGNIRYGFIHGNWALCNSRPDGDWCGVNEELGILSETGCYADFTFPSAPSPTQPRMVNAIYRAEDTPDKPRACDRGVPVCVRRYGKKETETRGNGEPVKRRISNIEYSISNTQVLKDPVAKSQVSSFEFPVSRITHPSTINHSFLLLITGPLALDWRRCKWGILPRLENGAITGGNPAIPERVDLWVKQHIHVSGRPEWFFVKVYTHGSVIGNQEVILGEPMRKAHEHLRSKYNDGGNWVLHYVTAREMYNIVRAAEDGMAGEPGDYRDYEINPPPGRG